MFALFFSEVWNHRKNRFIAVGGIAVLFIGIMMALVKIPGLPDWLFNSVAFCTGLFVLATLAMMVYYAARFIILGVMWLVRITFVRAGGNKFNSVEASITGDTVLGDLEPPPHGEIAKESHK